MTSPAATVLPPAPAPPEVIHSCPACSHWLPDGTLACPDCHTLTYGQHLNKLAVQAQQMEQEQRWVEAREMWASTLAWLPEDAKQSQDIRQHMSAIDARLQADQDQKAKWKKRLGPFAPIALFLMKIKSGLFLLFKLKFLLGIVSFFGLYWVIFGWRFALGFTLALFVHEMGHYIAVKRRGLKAELPMFFPGLGAYVRWYGQGVSREDLAAIALAGPLFGLTSALACLALAWGTRNMLFLVLTYAVAWVNFLNLIPLLGLDGAQASYALSRMQRGLIAATCIVFWALTLGNDFTGPGVQWIFLIVGLAMAWKCFSNDQPEQGHTPTFATFQGLVVVLGLVIRFALAHGVTNL
jgi:Zn-dependent protease/uncharacterized Zn finger protein (UPF0148 family)